MDTLAYFIYGSRREYHLELTYSVLSAVHWAKAEDFDLRVALITDEENRRPDLPVETVVFTPAEFGHWTGNGRYQHQAKLHALLKALDLLENRVALIDTDTYFSYGPTRLFARIDPGSSVMHSCEGVLGEDRYLRPIIERLGSEPHDYGINATTRLYNSGVIGLHHHDRRLLVEAARLCERLYAIYPAFNIEQFAVSIVLGQRTSLTTCSDLVRHYFGYERPFVRARIGELFPHFSPTQFQRHLHAPPNVDGFPKKRGLDQLKARLKALARREGSAYRFAYLASLSALSSVSHSLIHANIWAQITLDVLKRNEFVIADIERDFDAMRHLDASSWPSNDTRAAWRSFWGELASDRKRGQIRTTGGSSTPVMTPATPIKV